MAARISYFTDPLCAWSWNTEPKLRRLMVEFGDSLAWTYVMGGLARDITDTPDGGEKAFRWLLLHWLDVSEQGGMPVDPRLWKQSPIASSYPACMAVKAATMQSADAGRAYLRALREGLFWFRRKLDNTEALVEEARGAGLDVQRFRVDLASHASVEAFGVDLEATRQIPDGARERHGATTKMGGPERLTFPTLAFHGEDGSVRHVYGFRPYEEYREAALAAGAAPTDETPTVLEAVSRFGRMATKEVMEVCDLPEPRAQAELWQLASDRSVRPTKVLTGHLWEPA